MKNKKIFYLAVCFIGSVFAAQKEHWLTKVQSQLALDAPPRAPDALAMFKDDIGKKLLEKTAREFWKIPNKLVELLYGLATSQEADQENASQLLSMYLKAKKSYEHYEPHVKNPTDDQSRYAMILHGTVESSNLPCMKVLLDEAGVSHNLGIRYENDEFRKRCSCDCQQPYGMEVYPLLVVARKNETPESVRMFEFLCERGARFGHEKLLHRIKYDIKFPWATRYNALLKARRDKAVAEYQRRLLKEEPAFAAETT